MRDRGPGEDDERHTFSFRAYSKSFSTFSPVMTPAYADMSILPTYLVYFRSKLCDNRTGKRTYGYDRKGSLC